MIVSVFKQKHLVIKTLFRPCPSSDVYEMSKSQRVFSFVDFSDGKFK